MAETRQNGVVGKRSAYGELDEAPQVKKSKSEASVMYDVGLGEYTTGVPSSKVPIAGHSKPGEIISLLEGELTVAGPATSGAADTADDDETEPSVVDLETDDIVPHGGVPLTEDQRKRAEEAALKMDLRADSVGENLSFGELLDHSDVTKGTREDVEKFVKETQSKAIIMRYPLAKRDVMEFIDDTDRQDWHVHCPELKGLWHNVLTELRVILGEQSGLDTDEMVMPSGPVGAVFAIMWHYATPNTRKTNLKFGHVFDKANPSLRHQAYKIGDHGHVMTSDWLPFREEVKDPDWKSKFGDKWPEVQQLFTTFNYNLLRRSPIVLLVGTPVAKTFRQRFSDDSSLSVERVTLKLGNQKSLRDYPHFQVVRSKATNAVEQLVFAAAHGSRFYQPSVRTHEGIISDLVWNAAATIAGVRVKSLTHFTRAALTFGGAFGLRDMKAFWATERGKAIIASRQARKIGIFSDESRAKLSAFNASEQGRAMKAALAKDHKEQGIGLFSEKSRAANFSEEGRAHRAAVARDQIERGVGMFSEESQAKSTAIHADQQARGVGMFSQESRAKQIAATKEFHASDRGKAWRADQQARGLGLYGEEAKAKRKASYAEQQARGVGIHSEEAKAKRKASNAEQQARGVGLYGEEAKAKRKASYAEQQARGVGIHSEEAKAKRKASYAEQRARGVGIYSEEAKAKRAATQARKKKERMEKQAEEKAEKQAKKAAK